MATFTYTKKVAMTSCATSSDSPNLTVLATSAGSLGVAIGAVVSHANIPVGTTILSYNTTTQAVMSANAIATGSSLSVTATNPDIINIDAVALTAGKVGGDVYNISGPTLYIDQDSRVGLNQTTSTSLGSITLSATLGGSCEINSTKVRLIPYTSGTGTVPAWNTLITEGGASGELIGVYANLTVASTATGAAMPASGYIKIKQWNSIPFAIGTLSGISASASGTDQAGWLEIVGDEFATCTVNRLNLFKIQGDYFSIGSTTGNKADSYQIPSSGMVQYHAGVEVETAVGSNVYEFYPCHGSLSALIANRATDPLRGKVCWISTTGLVRFGNDGTNSTGGYTPIANLKIRIGNIFLVNCVTTTRTINALPNATLATRYEFATGGGGVLIMDKASIAWYLNIVQPYSVSLSNLGVCTAIVISEVATALTLNNVGIGQEAANTQAALSLSLCFAGGTVSNCTLLRSLMAAPGNYVAVIADINGFTFTNNSFETTVKASNATSGSLSIIRASFCSFTNTVLGAGRLYIVTCNDVTITDTVYYDTPIYHTLAAMPMYAFDLWSSCTRLTMSGLTFGGLYHCQPYNGIMNIGTAGCTDIKLRNIGTYANPLSLGSPRVDDQAWTRVTTTATVTSVAHGLLVNDTIYAVVSSDTGAFAVGAKTVVAVPTSDTFTFTCTNGGAASGTLCYFGTKSANVFVLSGGAAANNIKIQRVYAPHTRTNLYTVDNSSKNITMENVFSDFLNAPVLSMLNGYSKGVSGTPPLTAQTSVYGTHWFNGYVCDVANNTSSQSYTRTTTVATVTSVGHSLRTGMLINVDASTAPTTFTANSYSVTVISSSKFNITVASAGATSGSVSYRVANGNIGLLMNEATSDTSDRYTIDAGATAFTSAGGLYMPNINDQITFTTANYMVGQGSTFPIFEVMLGTGSLTNYTITYALDKNNNLSYGAFHNLYYERAGGSGSSGALTFTVTDTTGVEVGDYIWGTGISPRAKVTQINSNTITVDIANIATVSGIIRFNHLPSETDISPALGIKMKWRIKTDKANATVISSLYIKTESTDVGRANQYPLDSIELQISGLKSGSDVVVYSSASGAVRDSVDSVNSYIYVYETVENIDIGIFKAGYIPFYIRNYTLSSSNASLPVAQVADRAYL